MKYIEKPCSVYIEELASKAAVPGGGGTAALAGALGSALGMMVGSLTLGKKKYADVEEDIRWLMDGSDRLMKRLAELVDEDAAAFEPLSKAYSLPAGEEKDAVMEDCLRRAGAVPFEIMKVCCSAIDYIEGFAHKGSRLAVSDAGCGAVMLKSALQAASLNIYINTRSMKNREYAEKINGETQEMLDRYTVRADEIFDYVTGELK